LIGFDDGGYAQRTWTLAIVGFCAVTVLALLLRNDLALGPPEWVSIAGLAALSAWMVVSSAWGIPGTNGAPEAERALLYLSALADFLVVVRPERILSLLVGVVAGIVTVGSYALVRRTFEGAAHDPFEGSLLVGPLGYSNALGILAAVGLALAVALLLGERRRPAKALLVAAIAVLGATLALTSSRGAVLALVCGLLALALVHPRLTRPSRAWVAVGAVVLVCTVAWVGSSHPSTFGDRSPYWRAALDDAAAHPLVGSGAGSFAEYWAAHRTVDTSVQDAHSLYLESLSELGPVGLLLVPVVLVPPLAAVATRRWDASVAAAVGAYVAFLVHAGIDWDWEMPATTIAGLACAAALLLSLRHSRAARSEATPSG